MLQSDLNQLLPLLAHACCSGVWTDYTPLDSRRHLCGLLPASAPLALIHLVSLGLEQERNISAFRKDVHEDENAKSPISAFLQNTWESRQKMIRSKFKRSKMSTRWRCCNRWERNGGRETSMRVYLCLWKHLKASTYLEVMLDEKRNVERGLNIIRKLPI